MLPKNEGATDRDVRAIVAAMLMYLAVFQLPGVWSFVVGAVALVLFLTAVVGFCPLYVALRINTREPKSSKR